MGKKLTLSTIINFKKYKDQNKSVYDLIKEDFNYIEWVISIWDGEIDWKVEKYFKSQKDEQPIQITPRILPKTNIEVSNPNNKTIQIDGLPIKVLKSFLMFKEDQEIYYNDLFKYFTVYAISSLFQKQYIKIK